MLKCFAGAGPECSECCGCICPYTYRQALCKHSFFASVLLILPFSPLFCLFEPISFKDYAPQRHFTLLYQVLKMSVNKLIPILMSFNITSMIQLSSGAMKIRPCDSERDFHNHNCNDRFFLREEIALEIMAFV